jgi:hypothetical protein
LFFFLLKNIKRIKKRNKGGGNAPDYLYGTERKHIVACNQRFIYLSSWCYVSLLR